MNLDRKPIRRTATLVDRSEPKPGDYYWSHALLADGTALWSSPVFVGGHPVSRSNRAAEPSAQEPIDQALEADRTAASINPMTTTRTINEISTHYGSNKGRRRIAGVLLRCARS